jgi:hypothetical protein
MTNDELQQFKKLIDESNKQLRQELQQDFQNRLDAVVDPIHERLDTQREQISNVEKNLRQTIKEDIKDSEKNIIEQFSPITNLVLEHDEQIAELQKAVGLRPKH